MSDAPYIRLVVVHDDGTEAIYHVRRIVLGEPVVIRSDGVIIIEPAAKEEA